MTGAVVNRHDLTREADQLLQDAIELRGRGYFHNRGDLTWKYEKSTGTLTMEYDGVIYRRAANGQVIVSNRVDGAEVEGPLMPASEN